MATNSYSDFEIMAGETARWLLNNIPDFKNEFKKFKTSKIITEITEVGADGVTPSSPYPFPAFRFEARKSDGSGVSQLISFTALWSHIPDFIIQNLEAAMDKTLALQGMKDIVLSCLADAAMELISQANEYKTLVQDSQNVGKATPKQIKFATVIASTLGLKCELDALPNTVSEYSNWIGTHIDEFNKVSKAKKGGN